MLDFDDFGRAPLLYHQGAYSLVLPHPRIGRSPKGDPRSSGSEIGLEHNLLYLLLQAVNAYQSAYLPKQQALGLSVSEARVLILLSALNEARAEILQRESSLPGSEIREALDNLAQSGLVEREEDGNCRLSPAGQERARQYWALSEQEQQQVFAEFDPSGIDLFKQILQSIIRRAWNAKTGAQRLPLRGSIDCQLRTIETSSACSPFSLWCTLKRTRCPSFSDRWPHPRILR